MSIYLPYVYVLEYLSELDLKGGYEPPCGSWELTLQSHFFPLKTENPL